MNSTCDLFDKASYCVIFAYLFSCKVKKFSLKLHENSSRKVKKQVF